jgi:tungstate transport system substrate-binding protein
LKKIQAAQAPFVSRGDKSGTHMAELDCGRRRASTSTRRRALVSRHGQGMGPALNTAASMNAYVLADRGTWLAFKNRGDLAILVEGDKRLYNQYGVMLVNPASIRREEGSRPDVHRLARLAGGPEGDRRLQDRR